MSEPKRVESAPKQGKSMSTSVSPAAEEAFKFLNAGTRIEWRAYGDTKTAACGFAEPFVVCGGRSGDAVRRGE